MEKKDIIVRPVEPQLLVEFLNHEELTVLIREGIEKLKERNRENAQSYNNIYR